MSDVLPDQLLVRSHRRDELPSNPEVLAHEVPPLLLVRPRKVNRALALDVPRHVRHGNNARGAVGPDLTDDEWMRAPSDEMVFNTIKNGRSGTAMSGFAGDLTDEQIWTIITWLRDENRKRKEAVK